MNPTQLHDHAQAYVDRALDSQRRHGHRPHLSEEVYQAAVARAAKAFASLVDRSESSEDRDEDAVPA